VHDAAVARHPGAAALQHAVAGLLRHRRRTQVRLAASHMLARTTTNTCFRPNSQLHFSFDGHAFCGGMQRVMCLLVITVWNLAVEHAVSFTSHSCGLQADISVMATRTGRRAHPSCSASAPCVHRSWGNLAACVTWRPWCSGGCSRAPTRRLPCAKSSTGRPPRWPVALRSRRRSWCQVLFR